MGIEGVKWSKFRGGEPCWDQMTSGGNNIILLLLSMVGSKMAWGPHGAIHFHY